MLLKKENGWNKYSTDEKNWAFEFAEYYKDFLNRAKTEREVVTYALNKARKYGFVDAKNLPKIKAGDRIYYVNREKNLVLAIIGKKDIEKGANFIVSHIDSPRLDLKPNPLDEDAEVGFLRTHYYGGVKKYQWASIPLALHGVVVLESGRKVEISIGEKEEDPVFVIPDLLPHLSRKTQGKRKSDETIKGEELLLIFGSIPSKVVDKDIKKKIKHAIIKKLNEIYGMKEEDFVTAELEVVPALKARDVGIDKSLIGAYGQDDRVCAYTSLVAILDMAKDNIIPEYTSIYYAADKEEIGSSGSTGLNSQYLEYFMSDIIYRLKGDTSSHFMRKVLWNSRAISSDVGAAVNPAFKNVHEMENAAKINHGIILTKYTGSGGKYSANDADAEYTAEIRNIFNKNKIIWQAACLGKIDEGGGGTVAKFLAYYGIRTIDAGPGVLGMHSTFEVTSKLDVFETFKSYKAFFNISSEGEDNKK